MVSGNSAGTVRAFINIALDARVHEALAETAARLRRVVDARVRWVKPEFIHLTLAFLGEIARERANAAARAMEEAARVATPFEIAPGTVGGFPSLERPRVLWVGVTGDGGALAALQHDVAWRLGGEGFVLEGRPFAPHLTLGRVVGGGPDGGGVLARMPSALPHAGQIVRRVTLFQSDLHPDGAVYTVLAEAGLGGILSLP